MQGSVVRVEGAVPDRNDVRTEESLRVGGTGPVVTLVGDEGPGGGGRGEKKERYRTQWKICIINWLKIKKNMR